jgi:hypothetical protein
MFLFDLDYSSYIPHNLNLVNALKIEKRDREKRKKESGEVVRDTIFGGGGKKLYLRF